MESGSASPAVDMLSTPAGTTRAASRTSTPASSVNNGTMDNRTKIAVYCGSSPGLDPAHVEAARSLARAMAAQNIALVYGGGTVGLMGEVARTLVSLSGPESVHGIIPEALVKYEREPTWETSTAADPNDASTTRTHKVPEYQLYGRTTVVKDMHTRKHMMAKEVMQGGPGSGFIALGGGYGTAEELFETITWNQLGIHNKGIVVFNVNGFYDGFMSWIRSAVDQGFIKGQNGSILVEATDAEGAIRALREYKVSESVYKLTWGNE